MYMNREKNNTYGTPAKASGYLSLHTKSPSIQSLLPDTITLNKSRLILLSSGLIGVVRHEADNKQ